MNHISLLGRTTADTELKMTQTGKPVVSFSLAVKRPYTKDTTDFINVVAWDKQAELLSKYVRKGQLIAVEGYLTYRTFETQNGKRTVAEVIAEKIHFASSKADNPSPSVSVPFADNSAIDSALFTEINDTQDELPF